MKIPHRILILCAFIICVSLALPVSVYAHPGRTDSNGGHTDSDTGEYHYHHGYPAHDHYDMDGDGDIDCPYDFDDQTGVNSGSSSSNSNNSKGGKENNASSGSAPEHETEELSVPAWVYWVFGGQAILSFFLLALNRNKKETIERMIYEHKNDIATLKKSCDEKISKRKAMDAELAQLHSNIKSAKQEQRNITSLIALENKNLQDIRQLRFRAANAPLDISFSKNGLPVYWKPDIYKPYGDYTVFVSSKTDIYHTDRFCGGYRAREEHIFNVIDHARPCKKCAEGFFNFTTVPDWFAAKENIFDDPAIKVNWRDLQSSQ